MSILGPSAATVNIVMRRDHGQCARCGEDLHGDRGYDWSIHHRRNRGIGGSSLSWLNQPANLLPLCGSGTTGCHGWVESHRNEAEDDGFLVSKLGVIRPDEASVIHAVHGHVFLDDEGGWKTVGKDSHAQARPQNV